MGDNKEPVMRLVDLINIIRNGNPNDHKGLKAVEGGDNPDLGRR